MIVRLYCVAQTNWCVGQSASSKMDVFDGQAESLSVEKIQLRAW